MAVPVAEKKVKVMAHAYEDNSNFASQVERWLAEGWEMEFHLAAYLNEHGRMRHIWGYVAKKEVEPDPLFNS